jgi:uncharacterized protein (TIGR02594 family)
MEIQGPKHHPRIIEYLQSVRGLDEFHLTDETPWCSAFVNWCMAQAGAQRSHSPLARSWGSVGSPLLPGAPAQEGDIVVFHSRHNQINGHVGFYITRDQDRLLILGGNQGNRVSYQWYPTISRSLVLSSIRRISL